MRRPQPRAPFRPPSSPAGLSACRPVPTDGAATPHARRRKARHARTCPASPWCRGPTASVTFCRYRVSPRDGPPGRAHFCPVQVGCRAKWRGPFQDSSHAGLSRVSMVPLPHGFRHVLQLLSLASGWTAGTRPAVTRKERRPAPPCLGSVPSVNGQAVQGLRAAPPGPNRTPPGQARWRREKRRRGPSQARAPLVRGPPDDPRPRRLRRAVCHHPVAGADRLCHGGGRVLRLRLDPRGRADPVDGRHHRLRCRPGLQPVGPAAVHP